MSRLLELRHENVSTAIPPSRFWKPLKGHAVQSAFFRCDDPEIVVFGARQSGKSDVGRRKFVVRTMDPTPPHDRNYIVLCPVHRQAMRLHWRKLMQMYPPGFVVAVHKSDQCFELLNGARVYVGGADVPERWEGPAYSGAWYDEFADIRPETHDLHIGPALMSPELPEPGWAMWTSTPDVRAPHAVRRFRSMQDGTPGRSAFQWGAEGIWSPERYAWAQETFDDLTMDQEVRAKIVQLSGRCFTYDEATHMRDVQYDPTRPLGITMDFNVKPGSANVIQELHNEGANYLPTHGPGTYTAVLDEVYRPTGSSTELVCRDLIAKGWTRHEGLIYIYGDPSGGSRSTQCGDEAGNWGIVRKVLGPVCGNRLIFKVANADPGQLERVLSLNARLRTADGSVHFAIHPGCKQTREDLEFLSWKSYDGRSGQRVTAYEIDKSDKARSHWADGLCYYADEEFEGPKGWATKIAG